MLFHFIPDITGNSIGPYEALDQFKMVLPKEIPLAVDRWFGMLKWLEFNKSLRITMSLPSTQSGELLDLFGYELEHNQFRTFTNGKVMITVFKGKHLMRTASTCFRHGEVNQFFTTPEQILQTNLQPPEMQLSEEAVTVLQQLSRTDLVKLASALGKRSSKLFK